MISFHPFQYLQSNWLVSDAYRRPKPWINALSYSTYPSTVPTFPYLSFQNGSLQYQEDVFLDLSDFQSQHQFGEDKNHWNETQEGQLPQAFPSGDETTHFDLTEIPVPIPSICVMGCHIQNASFYLQDTHQANVLRFDSGTVSPCNYPGRVMRVINGVDQDNGVRGTILPCAVQSSWSISPPEIVLTPGSEPNYEANSIRGVAERPIDYHKKRKRPSGKEKSGLPDCQEHDTDFRSPKAQRGSSCYNCRDRHVTCNPNRKGVCSACEKSKCSTCSRPVDFLAPFNTGLDATLRDLDLFESKATISDNSNPLIVEIEEPDTYADEISSLLEKIKLTDTSSPEFLHNLASLRGKFQSPEFLHYLQSSLQNRELVKDFRELQYTVTEPFFSYFNRVANDEELLRLFVSKSVDNAYYAGKEFADRLPKAITRRGEKSDDKKVLEAKFLLLLALMFCFCDFEPVRHQKTSEPNDDTWLKSVNVAINRMMWIVKSTESCSEKQKFVDIEPYELKRLAQTYLSLVLRDWTALEGRGTHHDPGNQSLFISPYSYVLKFRTLPNAEAATAQKSSLKSLKCQLCESKREEALPNSSHPAVGIPFDGGLCTKHLKSLRKRTKLGCTEYVSGMDFAKSHPELAQYYQEPLDWTQLEGIPLQENISPASIEDSTESLFSMFTTPLGSDDQELYPFDRFSEEVGFSDIPPNWNN